MQSSTQQTGFVPAATPNEKRGNRSAIDSPRLPLFSAANGSFRSAVIAPLGTDASHTTRRHRELDQQYRLRRHVKAVAEAEARGRTIGNLFVVAFTVLAIGMAAYALRVDQEQQQMLQERIH